MRKINNLLKQKYYNDINAIETQTF